MDTFRGFDDSASGGSDDYFRYDDDDEMEVPPSFGDERRMQVRAYNFWTGLLGEGTFPSIEDLEPEEIDDFRDNSVLLDFTSGIDDPAIVYLGTQLRRECEIEGEIGHISEVPPRSLLSRITDHYLQIIANRAPVGFEAEFVNQRGRTILYRGILLPFSSDDQTIDFIFGVINWKELADAQTADELLLEIGQALDGPAPEGPAAQRAEPLELSDWADGPGSALGTDGEEGLPVPSFGLDDPEFGTMPAVASPLAPAMDSAMALADWLAAAREQALQARSNEDRTRGALYEAIGRAHDFALAAAQAPEEFAELVADAGLVMQQRAPMTPVVKLVFGADYDKTRLTEYAAALLHAQRVGLGRGQLAAYLGRVEGGLKGVVAEERRLRRDHDAGPSAPVASGPRKAVVRKLRALPTQTLAEIPGEGAEFALVLVRRMPDGAVALLGEVPQDTALVERAARKLAG